MYDGTTFGNLSSPYSDIGGPGGPPVMTTGSLAGPRVLLSSSDDDDEYAAATMRESAILCCLTGGLLETGDVIGAGTGTSACWWLICTG